MPRANRHVLPGHSYHVTHRCHDRDFLLKFARDRNAYRSWLRRGLEGRDVVLLTYCITSNHVHLLLRAESTEELAAFIQYVHGNHARAFNARKSRSGAFWSDRYHATLIENGDHLWQCMAYIDLNMVRARVIQHPSEWDWTGWRELMGVKKRNRVISLDSVLEVLRQRSVDAFRTNYETHIANMCRGSLAREPRWSESVAVGSQPFIDGIADTLLSDYTRKSMDRAEEDESVWVLRETSSVYYG